jgi:hypothetical protein
MGEREKEEKNKWRKNEGEMRSENERDLEIVSVEKEGEI